MKKIMLIGVLIGLAGYAFSQPANRLRFLLDQLADGGRSGYVMIFAHRGDWRNAPENSLQAYQNCINAGIDGIEIDVQETKDGQLVVMHDETLNRTTTGKGRVADYTLADIQQLQLKSPIGVVVNQHVPSFEEVLELAKGQLLIHVDKWPPVKDKVIAAAQKHGMLNQLILRSSYNSEKVKALLGTYLDSVHYVPVLVCDGKNDNARLDDYLQHLKSEVVSLSFTSDSFQVIARAADIQKKGCRVWYNSLWATFNGGHDDELAVTDPKNSYQWLLDKGANIIFSDRPLLLLSYLQQHGYHNAAPQRAAAIREKLMNKNGKEVLVVAHRAGWRETPENSLQAIDNAIRKAVDIIEVDVQKTKDGQLILMHDKTLNRTTTGKGYISDWTLDSIKTLRLKNGAAIKTRYTVPTLEEALLLAKGKIMINLDKAYNLFDDVYPLLEKTGTTSQIIMKGTQTVQEVQQQFGKYLDKVIFMPIVDLDKADAMKRIQDYLAQRQPAAFELLYTQDTNPLPGKLVHTLAGKSLIWYNTLWDTMAGGHDDDQSVEDIEKGYGYLIDTLHARLLQTDRFDLLIDYLEKRKLR